MENIAYTIIGVGIGGVVFVLLKKLPQFVSSRKKEFDSLRLREKKTGLREAFSLKKVLNRASEWGNYLKNQFCKIGSKVSRLKDFGRWIKTIVTNLCKNIFSGLKVVLAKFSVLKDKVNFSLPRSFKKERDTSALPIEQSKEEEEFFAELLSEEEEHPKEKQSEQEERNSSVDSKQTGKEESPESEQQSEEEIMEKQAEVTEKEKNEIARQSKSEEEERLIKALREDPKNGSVYKKLGFLYYERGDYRKAGPTLKAAKRLGVESAKLDQYLDELEDEDRQNE